LVSELSSFLDEKAGISPFVPYRINEQNMRKLDAIFGNNTDQESASHIGSVLGNTVRDFMGNPGSLFRSRVDRDSFDTLSLSESSWGSVTPRSLDAHSKSTMLNLRAGVVSKAKSSTMSPSRYGNYVGRDMDNGSVSSLGSISIVDQSQNFDSLYLQNNRGAV